MSSSALALSSRVTARLSCHRHHLPQRHHNHIQSPRFRILFFGRDEFSCEVFKRLHAAPDVWESITIATHQDAYIGRRKSVLSVSPLKTLGESLSTSVLSLPSHKSMLEHFLPPAPFVSFPLSQHVPSDRNVLITASFGWIIPPALLNLFAPGRKLNVHPSLLPAYRGAAPIQHVILNDEKETGVSIIEMMEVRKSHKRKSKGEIDSGDIWAQTRVPVPPEVTFPVLRDALAKTGGALLVSTLRKMLSSHDAPLNPLPQTHASDAPLPRAPLIRSSDVNVNFEAQTAPDIVRRHRALLHHKPLTGFFTHLGSGALSPSDSSLGKRVQLHDPVALPTPPTPRPKTRPPGLAYYDRKTDSVCIECAEDTVLSVPRLKRQNKVLIRAKDWWNGEGKRLEDGRGVLRFVPPPPGSDSR